MKKRIKCLGILGIFLFGCATSNNTMKNNINKDTYMEIKTFEKYMKQKKFVLPVCENKKYDGTIYLEDSTKIEYSCPLNKDDLIGETITSSKYPFVEFYRRYYSDSKSLAVIYTKIGNMDIGTYRHYDTQGKLVREIVYKQDTSNLPYTTILQSLEKLGYLDLKNVKIIKGTSQKFELNYSLKSNIDLEASREKIPKELLNKFEQSKGIWRYTINIQQAYPTMLRSLVFDDIDGSLLYIYEQWIPDTSEMEGMTKAPQTIFKVDSPSNPRKNLGG